MDRNLINKLTAQDIAEILYVADEMADEKPWRDEMEYCGHILLRLAQKRED